MEGERAESPVTEQLLDDVLPEELDWRRLVTDYPKAALAVAAVGGFFLGRQHGDSILAALSGFAEREVKRNVHSLLGEDGFE